MKQTATILLLSMMMLVMALPSCNNDDDDNTPIDTTQVALEYISLELDVDTLLLLDTTHVMANANGYNMEYYWSATMGDILGSGKKVTYLAPNCTVGEQTISCRILNGDGDEETKTVNIMIVEQW